MAGYSGTPLAKKLGIGPGTRLALVGEPAGYAGGTLELPEGVDRVDPSGPADVVQVFATRRAELDLKGLKEAIRPNGALWVSWPKKASKVPTDLTEDVIRAMALEAGLVDVKVCAVDAVWSGLKLVFRRADR